MCSRELVKKIKPVGGTSFLNTSYTYEYERISNKYFLVYIVSSDGFVNWMIGLILFHRIQIFIPYKNLSFLNFVCARDDFGVGRSLHAVCYHWLTKTENQYFSSYAVRWIFNARQLLRWFTISGYWKIHQFTNH